MASSIYKIQTVPDRKIIEAMHYICNKYVKNNASLTINVIGVSPGFILGANEKIQDIFTDSSRLIESVSFGLGHYSVSFHRGGAAQPLSPYYDEIEINIVNNVSVVIGQDDQLNILVELQKEFPPLEMDEGRDFNEDVLAVEAGIHGRILSRLENTATELIEKVAEHKARIDEDFREKISEFEDRVKNEIRVKNDDLSRWELELQERQKTIDDSDNTFARRKLRDQMLLDVKSRIDSFGVSEATEKKREPVKRIYQLILAVMITFVIVFGVEMLNSFLHAADSGRQTFFYVVLLKLTLSVVGFVAVAIYYLKWEGRWADQHAANEFQLQQFYLDISRANWVVETGLEWKKETGEAMPELLLGNISGKLFALHGDEGDKAINPADELASALLGSSSKLKLKMGENEMEFNKPAKIKSTVSSSGE